MRPTVVALAAIALAACERAPDDAPAPAAGDGSTSRQASNAPTPVADKPPGIALLEQQLAYGEAEQRNLVGFLAVPADVVEPPPGLLVIHEASGLNEDIKSITRELAGQGYIALAVDLYGGEIASTPDEARRLMATVVRAPEAAQANLRQAYEYLERYALSPRVGVIGWNLGGDLALQAAILLPDRLDALVLYYGQVVTNPEELRPLQMPVLGFYGALDESIPIADARAFRSVLASLGKNARIVTYPDAGHAFANPSARTYNLARATAAWELTLGFLAEHLQQ